MGGRGKGNMRCGARFAGTILDFENDFWRGCTRGHGGRVGATAAPELRRAKRAGQSSPKWVRANGMIRSPLMVTVVAVRVARDEEAVDGDGDGEGDQKRRRA